MIVEIPVRRRLERTIATHQLQRSRRRIAIAPAQDAGYARDGLVDLLLHRIGNTPGTGVGFQVELGIDAAGGGIAIGQPGTRAHTVGHAQQRRHVGVDQRVGLHVEDQRIQIDVRAGGGAVDEDTVDVALGSGRAAHRRAGGHRGLDRQQWCCRKLRVHQAEDLQIGQGRLQDIVDLVGPGHASCIDVAGLETAWFVGAGRGGKVQLGATVRIGVAVDDARVVQRHVRAHAIVDAGIDRVLRLQHRGLALLRGPVGADGPGGAQHGGAHQGLAKGETVLPAEQTVRLLPKRIERDTAAG